MTKTKAQHAQESAAPTGEQLERIGALSRRALTADEVYVFSLILCDNEVDRDFERFDDAALEKLGALFTGTTGVFDHAAKAENQSARIFETQVVETGAQNSLGMPYRCLKAWAYMARCGKNADLILEIDAGIKKEVSVGCAVGQVMCSVCGGDQKSAPCAHKKGKVYDGAPCHHVLRDPTDAYEWSFVAVPAQKNAGVVKFHRYDTGKGSETMELHKLFDGQGDITLTGAQRRELAEQYEKLAALAGAGRDYLEDLRRDVVRLTLLSQPQMDPQVMEQVASGMDAPQLKAFRQAFAEGADRKYPMPQLAAERRQDGDDAVKSYRM